MCSDSCRKAGIVVIVLVLTIGLLTSALWSLSIFLVGIAVFALASCYASQEHTGIVSSSQQIPIYGATTVTTDNYVNDHPPVYSSVVRETERTLKDSGTQDGGDNTIDISAETGLVISEDGLPSYDSVNALRELTNGATEYH